MKISIILNEPYPEGMACTKRIHLYAKGLIKNGWDVKIIIPKSKLDDKKQKYNRTGYYEGVPYFYMVKSPYKSKYFISRRISEIIGPLRAARRCVKEKPDYLLLVGGLFYYVILFKIVCIRIQSKYLREKSEVPYMRQNSISYRQKLYLKLSFSLFDIILTITDKLAEYFRHDLRLNVTTYTIPILIDPKYIDNSSMNIKRKNYLLYTGSLLDRKDGIINILIAFSKLLIKNKNLKLYITGNTKSSHDYNTVMSVIKKFGLRDYIVFTGFVSNGKLNELMREARLLVLVKPDNRQNEYNFSTKIGEYLISGSPVLCTENSTINQYFDDQKNMFICKNSVDEIADKMDYIINNTALAEKVAKRGKLLAEKLFDYEYQMKKLTEFLLNG